MMPSSVCQKWPSDRSGSAGNRGDCSVSYTTRWDTILIIIVPQVTPSLQRELFSLVLSELDSVAALLNEEIEVTIEDGNAVISRFEIPQNS
jgi:hypothetical protein